MHIAIWLLIAIGAGLWTLLAWGLAALLGLDPSWVDDIVPLLDRVPFAHVIDGWLPGWQELVIAMLALMRAMLAWAGSFGIWLVWGAWALGALGLLALGGVLSLIVALVRRADAPAAPAAA